jgi:hypothetical protein
VAPETLCTSLADFSPGSGLSNSRSGGRHSGVVYSPPFTPPASAPMPTPGDALEVTPHPLSLGVVKAGAKARAEVCLANRGARAVVTQ